MSLMDRIMNYEMNFYRSFWLENFSAPLAFLFEFIKGLFSQVLLHFTFMCDLEVIKKLCFRTSYFNQLTIMSDNLPPTTLLLHVFSREFDTEQYVSHPVLMRTFSANLYRTGSGVLHVYRARHLNHPGRALVELEVYGNLEFVSG